MGSWNMRKLILCLLLLCLISLPCLGAESPEDLYSQLEDQMLGDQLTDSLPREVQDQLKEQDLSPEKESLETFLSFEKVLNFLTGGLLEAFKGTLKDFAIVISITLIFAVLSTLRSSLDSKFLTSAFSIAATVCIALTLFSSVREGYVQAVDAVQDMSFITKGTLPVMAAAMASSGAPTSATALSAALMIGLDVVSELNRSVLLPVLNLYTALCIAGSINSNIRMSGIIKLIKNVMIWGMTLVSTLFAGVLSMQKLITASSDTLAGRSAKFAFASAVPIVGSTLRDAMDTVFSCIGTIKNTVGVFAVIAILMTVLPSIFKAAAYYLMLSVSGELSELAGEDKIAQLIRGLGSAWSIILAVTVMQVFAVIISLTLLMGVKSG